jgi:hypothetical protein
LRYPIAAQAAFAALAAEGRRFAQTDEGAAWKERLASSKLVAELRVIWDSLGMTAFVEKPTEALPTFFVDGLVNAASSDDVESLLSQVLKERM